MPKTDMKKIESEDVKELSDEALDEARAQVCYCPSCGPCTSPAE